MLSKRVAAVDKHRCVACGACTKVCPKGAVTVRYGCYGEVDGQLCVGCGKCARECPADCITLVDREVRA